MVDAADGLPVVFDPGVRSGADIVKALALGATAVAVGRPYAYGLATGGTPGVVHVLRALLAEVDLIMAIDGYPILADLTREALRPTRGTAANPQWRMRGTCRTVPLPVRIPAAIRCAPPDSIHADRGRREPP